MCIEQRACDVCDVYTDGVDETGDGSDGDHWEEGWWLAGRREVQSQPFRLRLGQVSGMEVRGAGARRRKEGKSPVMIGKR